jgi:hypothetical protein
MKILIYHPLHLNLKVKPFQINFTLCKIPEVCQPINNCEGLKTYKVTLVKEQMKLTFNSMSVEILRK